MFRTQLYNNFCFLKIRFNKFHYTDHRYGSPLHYFAYMEKGNSKIVTKNKTVYVNEGEIFFIPKNLSYQSYWYGDEEISFFSFGCSDLLSHDTDFLDLQLIKCPHELALLLTEIPTDGNDISTQAIGTFFCTVAKLLPYMNKISVSTSHETLILAKEHLNKNPYYSNNELATLCNISLPYLYKIFKKCDDETPNTYRQKVLCDKARDLLTTTDLSIEQISSILKFSSSGYFRKVFKEHSGMTPREVRKLYSF